MTLKELFDGILGPFIRGMGCISVNRKIKDKKVLVNANSVLESNSRLKQQGQVIDLVFFLYKF